MNVLYLKYNHIDKEKWNKSLSKCVNVLTYAYSWYLDTVCENWDALVTEDYSILMPLPVKGRFYLNVFMPQFIPKLGIFYLPEINKSDLNIFINALPNNIKTFNIIFNKFNDVQNKNLITKKTYYSIDLYDNYHKYYENYSTYLKTLLHKNKSTNYIISGISTNDVIAYLNKTEIYNNNKNFETLRRVLSVTSIRKLSNISAVFSETNELIGIGIFILASYSTDLIILSSENKNEVAVSLIIDKFIKTNAGKNITLNFENEEYNNIYEEFSAQKYYYEEYFFRKLPKIFKIFKKKY